MKYFSLVNLAKLKRNFKFYLEFYDEESDVEEWKVCDHCKAIAPLQDYSDWFDVEEGNETNYMCILCGFAPFHKSGTIANYAANMTLLLQGYYNGFEIVEPPGETE